MNSPWKKFWSKLPLALLLSLFILASAKAYIKIQTTIIGYKIGQKKQRESELLENQSTLKMELARLTTRQNLSQLALKNSDQGAKQSWASY
jgi:hypothetical protein